MAHRQRLAAWQLAATRLALESNYTQGRDTRSRASSVPSLAYIPQQTNKI
jgi:hypothetical protein